MSNVTEEKFINDGQRRHTHAEKNLLSPLGAVCASSAVDGTWAI